MEQLDFFEIIDKPTSVCPVCEKIFEKTHSRYERVAGPFKKAYCSRICKNTALLKKYKEYCQKNKEKISKRNKTYRLNNIEKFKQKDKENDIKYRLQRRLRTRIYNVLFRQKAVKSKKTLKLLGCSWQKAREHIQSQFKEGMAWENYGKYGWHIDHIIPCSSFDLTDPEEQKKCFHYTNIQPLWWHENLSKGAKILLEEGV